MTICDPGSPHHKVVDRIGRSRKAELAPKLFITYLDCTRELRPGEELTFGRAGNLVIDENPYLHRVLGRFSFKSDFWWLMNVGSKISIELLDATSQTSAVITSGRQIPITTLRSLVRFQAGPSPYEIQVISEEVSELVTPAKGPPGAVTARFGVIDLTAEQRMVLAALCEPRLLSECKPIPGNKELALRLGWTVSRCNRQLDRLCQRLERAGVPGLRGDAGSLATNRRYRLVEHALRVGLVGPADLRLLPDAGAA